MNDAASRRYAVQAPRARLRVELGARSYDVVIGAGALDELGALDALAPRGARLFAVADETVAALHGRALETALSRAGRAAEMVRVPPGEASKSFAMLERVVGALLERRIERGDLVIAFGGGVIGDLAGFAAGIVLRGVRYVQVPTTLLAQVDSSVGGKTGIDTRHGKNLVGAFHQPALVVADTALLDTLPRRDMLAGYAEIAKIGLIRDRDFFAWLEVAARGAIERAGPERTGAIYHSCRAKAAIVAADEREAGERALLNLGHTFAHALETECGYDDTLRHGEAVALGIVLAFALSAELGLCAPGDGARVARHFAEAGLPTGLGAGASAARRWPAERLLTHMYSDKKVRAGALTFILARGIGAAFIARDVPAEPVRKVLAAAGAV